MRRCVAALAILSLLVVPSVCRAFQYSVTDLGTGPNGNGVLAHAINNLEQIAGIDPYPGAKNVFLWSPQSGMETLFPGIAFGINDRDQFVGAFLEGNATTHAFVWSDSGGAVDIGTLGGSYSEAYDINNSGQAVGRAFTAGNAGTFAFTWSESGGIQSLGSFTGTSVGTSQAQAINNLGQVVGWSDVLPTGVAAFLWSESTGMVNLGDFGTPNRHGSYAYGINDVGQVVGHALTANNANAFFWSTETGMVDLGTLPGHLYSQAYGINNAGQIVGFSYDNNPLPPFGPGVLGPTAMIYEDWVMKDLNNSIAPNSGWFLQEALAINEHGQIAGRGRFNGQARSFLLTPIPEPSACVTAGLGLLVMLSIRSRQCERLFGVATFPWFWRMAEVER